MRKYELAIVLDSTLKEEEREKIIAALKGEIEKLGGKVEKSDSWGKKSLASPLKKAKEGIFYLFNLSLEESSPKVLGEKLRLQEEVLRYLLIRVEEKKTPPSAKVEVKEEKKEVKKKTRGGKKSK